MEAPNSPEDSPVAKTGSAVGRGLAKAAQEESRIGQGVRKALPFAVEQGVAIAKPAAEAAVRGAKRVGKAVKSEMGAVAGPALIDKVRKSLLGVSGLAPGFAGIATGAAPARAISAAAPIGSGLGASYFTKPKATARKSMTKALKGIKPKE
jgi:hypothetical protein